MAAKPIPMPGDGPEIVIDENGHVSPDVEIDNGGQITFRVAKYRGGDNVCKITISASNVSWHRRDDFGGNSIKVGGGTGPLNR